MSDHGKTRPALPSHWVLVPVDLALKADLIALASVERKSVQDYCAWALRFHVYGHQALLDQVSGGVVGATQKEWADGGEMPDPLGL